MERAMLLCACACLGASPDARADIALAEVSFPLGSRCRKALEAARDRFDCGCTNQRFPLEAHEDAITGSTSCADRCGVYVRESIFLRRDGEARARTSWRRLVREEVPGDRHVLLTRRAAGWRATIDIVESGLRSGNFEPIFRHAVDVCLDALPDGRDL